MAKKNKSVRRRRKRRVLFGIELFVLLILVGGLFIYAKVNEKMNKLDLDNNSEEASKVEVNEDVIGSKTLKGFTNIALFGVDNREENVKSGQSDTTIIASINNDTKEVKLVSLYRDTYLNIGNDVYTRCNAAYNTGGPTQAMSMINTNLDLNITNYVAVNFKALATAIDCLGGLDVEMTYVEIKNMNDYCVETSEVTGMDYEPIEMPEYPGDDKQESEILGSFHLNGVQATSYCRIRYTASLDMGRTERQRRVLGMLFDKAKIAGLSSIFKIMDDVFPMVTTSLSKQDILGLIPTLIGYKFTDSTGFPQKFKFSNIKGSIIVPTDLENNVVELHKFLYDDQDYTPSSEVVARSNKILEIVGGEGKLDDAAKTTTQDTDTTNANDTFVWSGDNTSGSTDNSGDYDSDYDNGGYDGGYDNGGDDTGSDTGGGDYDGGDDTGGGDYDGGDDTGGDETGGDDTGGDETGGDDGFSDDSAADSGASSEEQ